MGCYIGIDVGAGTTKGLILDDDGSINYYVIPTGGKVKESSEQVLNFLLNETGASFRDIKYVVSTGYGRGGVPFSNKPISEIICCAKGVKFLYNSVRTIIDIGCQDSKVIGLDENGRVRDFVMNDRCAAGTGRFLEVMANVLGVGIEDLGKAPLLSDKPCVITSTCTVFAESEVVSYRAQGRRREDILAGLHNAIAKRVINMGRQVGYLPDIIFTGGVAKNIGMRCALKNALNMEVIVPTEPQIMTALGAALFAVELHSAEHEVKPITLSILRETWEQQILGIQKKRESIYEPKEYSLTTEKEKIDTLVKVIEKQLGKSISDLSINQILTLKVISEGSGGPENLTSQRFSLQG